jgi:hypothetical protein
MLIAWRMNHSCFQQVSRLRLLILCKPCHQMIARLCVATSMHIASMLTGDVELDSFWSNRRKNAASLAALSCTCATLSTTLKRPLAMRRLNHQIRIRAALCISSYLTGVVENYQMTGRHSKKRAADAVPLFKTCSMCSTGLGKKLTMLFFDYMWHLCYTADYNTSAIPLTMHLL